MRWNLTVLLGGLFVASSALADTATFDVISENVQAADNVLTITVALPAEAVGMRISRAILEVPVSLNESANEGFNELPVLELYEEGSESPKQTILLEAEHDGIARIDVTRFVREWANTASRDFVLGAVSESNGTALDLGTAAGWPNGTKARLMVTFSDRDGASVAVE
jgi:hypothetical protein